MITRPVRLPNRLTRVGIDCSGNRKEAKRGHVFFSRSGAGHCRISTGQCLLLILRMVRSLSPGRLGGTVATPENTESTPVRSPQRRKTCPIYALGRRFRAPTAESGAFVAGCCALFSDVEVSLAAPVSYISSSALAWRLFFPQPTTVRSFPFLCCPGPPAVLAKDAILSRPHVPCVPAARFLASDGDDVPRQEQNLAHRRFSAAHPAHARQPRSHRHLRERRP